VNALQKLGAIMIILGIVLPFLGIALPSLATVYYYPPPSIGYTCPSSTSSSSPDSAMVAQSYKFIAYVSAEAGVKSVTVDVYRASDNARLGLFTLNLATDVYGNDYYMYLWTLPNTPGLLKCVFTAVDKIDQTSSKTTFLNVAYATGDFYINDQKVSESSVLKVSSPELRIKFVPADSSSASAITKVFIDVKKDGAYTTTLYPTKGSDGTWSITYTLPGYGTYTLDGFFEVGGSRFKKMELTIPFGTETLNIPDVRKFINVFTVFGIVLYAFGSLQKRRW
jgi:hypothetical protein